MKTSKEIEAYPQANGDGHQVIISGNNYRKVYRFPVSIKNTELMPHAAGSFHNPDYYHSLMNRVSELVKSF